MTKAYNNKNFRIYGRNEINDEHCQTIVTTILSEIGTTNVIFNKICQFIRIYFHCDSFTNDLIQFKSTFSGVFIQQETNIKKNLLYG